jgi:integrase
MEGAMKLTASAIRSLTLPKGKLDYIEFDDAIPGFGLRIRDGGSRTWIFQYKLGSKQRRIVLGKATALPADKARDLAADHHAAVHLGRDPAGERAAARASAAETFETAVRLFLEHQKARLRPRSYPDVERHLLVHAKALHGLQLAKVARRDIASCITTVAQNRGAVTGNRVRTSLSSLFAWAMQQGLVDGNPVIGTARNQERPRDRVLEPAELRLIWNALGADDFGNIIKLLALTGQRASEIAGLCWSEVRDDLIVLSGERTKNHRPHTVPLSGAARAILDAQTRRPRRDLVFGNGEGPFSGWSNCKERLDERIAEAAGKPLPHWTPHDLRRTAATRMADIGIQPHIIEAVLNHVSGHKGGVAGIYNRSTYDPEKRAALNLWAEQLLAWVEGRESNVTPLRRIG